MSPYGLRPRKRRLVIEASTSGEDNDHDNENGSEITISKMKSMWTRDLVKPLSKITFNQFDFIYEPSKSKSVDWDCLLIQSKKLNEIEAWFTSLVTNLSSSKKHLILSGPSGCGKSTVIRAACHRHALGPPLDGYQLNAKQISSLITLAPLTNCRDTPKQSNQSFPPLSLVSTDCTDSGDEQSIVYESAPLIDSRPTIILFDDLPNEEVKKSLEMVIKSIMSDSRAVFIFIVTIPCNPWRAITDDPLFRMFLAGDTVTHIQMNPLVKTALQKLAISKGSGSETIEDCQGDGRSFLIDSTWITLLENSKLYKSNNKLLMDRDAKLNLFHELGRILYGKTLTMSFEWEDVAKRAPFLFANYPQFIGEERRQLQIAEAFSVMDAAEWAITLNDVWQRTLGTLPEILVNYEASRKPSSGFKAIQPPPPSSFATFRRQTYLTE